MDINIDKNMDIDIDKNMDIDMIIIIPLGGIGQRFKKGGFSKPKALIDVFGKPIIYYLLDNLSDNISKLNNKSLIYIPYNKEYIPFNFENIIKNKYSKLNLKFFKLENETRGAAETIYIALKN